MFQALTSYDNSEGGAKKNKQEKKKGERVGPALHYLKFWKPGIKQFSFLI